MFDKGWPPPVGAKLRETYGHPGGHLDKLWHVRGHVDGLIVVRRWFKRKQCWHYEVLSLVWWHVNMGPGSDGHLTVENP